MKPQTATAKATEAFKAGNTAAALRIFKDFGRVFSKQELRTLQIAYESITGKGAFYQTIGIDTEATCAEATELIRLKFNL